MPAIVQKLSEPPRKAIYQDVLDAPSNMVAQIIGGELYLHARPADPHAWACVELLFEVKLRFGRSEGGDGLGDWVILYEPELHLGKDVLAPDIAA